MILDRIRTLQTRSLLEATYAILWKLGLRLPAPKAAHRVIFERIYSTNEWGSPESRSGPGSTRARGAELRQPLLDLLARHRIATLLDVPCGDFNWLREMTFGLSSYVGVDIVEDLVANNTDLYGDQRHSFLCRDFTRDPLPKADLILCRDALIHLSFADIWCALENFKRSSSQFLLTTSFIDLQHNQDTRTGGWRPLNLQSHPFGFPKPVDVVEDVPAGDIAPGKRLCLWRIATLPMHEIGRRAAK